MSLYTRARKHIDMDRVKELREEKIREEIIRQQQLIIAEIKSIDEKNKCVDWRRELEEGMNTSGMGMINLPAQGDVNLGAAMSDISLSGDGGEVGYNAITRSSTSSYKQFDTMVVTISTTSSHWVLEPGDDVIGLAQGGAGTHTIISKSYSSLYFSAKDDGTFSASVQYQRRAPVNVFVSLDDPDANAFIRDGDFDRLSNEEKKKRLEEQLRASKEYLNKMFGDGMPGTATEIADYEPQQSFADIAQGLPYTDEDDAFDDPYYKGPPPDLDDDSDFDPDSFEYARIYPPDADPGDIQWPRKKNQKVPPGPGARPSGKPIGPELPRARKKQRTMVAHHELEGKVIKEKKTHKDITKKIPGYYDGKPSPLGFPVEEPPKMKNGYHPDLVDGKKVAQRFNRLDPISARAMPKTGNPHIDKKVRAARNVVKKESNNLYTKALIHIDMDRVKELREEKIKRKKIAYEIREQIREELRNINSPEFSNWRGDLDEGMTSSGAFQTVLPAMGDVDLSVTSMDASSFDTPEDISFNSGTNSGFTGGFSADDGIMNFSGDVDFNTNVSTNALDLSQVDTVNISAIAGNNSNGGMLPSNDLIVNFIDQDVNVSDDSTVISKTSSSFTNVNINIPQEFRKPGVKIFLFSTTGSSGDQGQHLKPFTISISGLNHATMGSIPVGAGSATGVNNTVTSYLQRSATTANYKALGVYLWDNIQIAKNGFSLGNNPNFGQPGETEFINLNTWDPAPVSGNRNQFGTAPDANGNDAPGVTDADYIYIGQHMFDTYKGSKLYGVSNISLKRRTPMSVFVSLDSPEATAFIRSDPSMQGLSSEEKKKKLVEMLKSSQEYLDKMFGEGMPKGATEVADYEPQQSFIDQLNPNIVGRGLRSVTDQARFGGDKMFQGNPKGRAPGLSNYWSPEPQTAATYSNPGAGKGIPGRGPDPTGTLTTTQRPPGTPRVTRGLTGTPQFKFPQGSPPPANMLTQMADDAAVAAAKKAAATKTGKLLGRAVPVAGAAIAVADASIRVNNGDYAGAVLSGLSAIPGPAGWAALGLQIATDAAGFTGGVKEQQEFDNYGDYIKGAAKIAKKNKIKIDRNAMLDLFLRELSKNNKLSDKDKEFLVAIFTDAEGLEKDDVISFVKKIQKKLMDGESIKEQIITEKKRLKSVKDIPGYYDGKPSPLGFPVEEPPKMKNGFHPDLVDGKKVANRFNRLDPTSAKAMPPTGNPHIDKKVRAAAKKPK